MADVQRLADYRIDREISRSAIASVYEGYQESLDRQVLIKRLHPQLVRDAEIRARFEREARALARIKHKNIVHIYDYRADDELVLLVSEWISGGSLEEYVRKNGPLSEPEAVAVAMDVLEGLNVAHEAGIIHRDIKPGNLLVARSGAIKITDFGLAQFEGSPNLTQQGVIMGTPAYMAPELVSGAPADARADLYNLGVTLYELLSGFNPFRADNLSQTLNKIVSVKPEPLGGIDLSLNHVLMALMDKKPEKRPASAAEAIEMLRPLAVRLGVERGWAAIRQTQTNGNGSRVLAAIRPIKRAKPRGIIVLLAATVMVATTITLLLTLHPKTAVNGAGETAAVPSDTASAGQPSTSKPLVESSSPDTEQTSKPAGQETRTTPAETAPTQPAPNEVGQTQSDRSVTVTQPEHETSEPSTSTKEPPQTKTPPSNENESAVGETGLETQPATSESSPSSHAEPEKTEAGPGYLFLHVQPWANVYFRDRFLVQTPYNHPVELPAGKVVLTLINPEFPPVNQEVTVQSGDTSNAYINLFNKVVSIEFIDAVPWAEVYLDGDYLGRTPIGRQIFIKPGHHHISFRHPSLKEKDIDFDATLGEEPRRFRVNLTKP